MDAKKSLVHGSLRAALITALALLVPLVSMQFSTQVNWGLADFIVIGALIFSASLVYELVLRHITSTWHRLILAVVLLAIVALAWAELAVGVFGTPFAGN